MLGNRTQASRPATALSESQHRSDSLSLSRPPTHWHSSLHTTHLSTPPAHGPGACDIIGLVVAASFPTREAGPVWTPPQTEQHPEAPPQAPLRTRPGKSAETLEGPIRLPTRQLPEPPLCATHRTCLPNRPGRPGVPARGPGRLLLEDLALSGEGTGQPGAAAPRHRHQRACTPVTRFRRRGPGLGLQPNQDPEGGRGGAGVQPWGSTPLTTGQCCLSQTSKTSPWPEVPKLRHLLLARRRWGRKEVKIRAARQ